MPLKDGIYVITNFKHDNLVFLPDPNHRTPLQGYFRRDIPGELWRVEERLKERYSIRNVSHESFATSGSRAQVKDVVEGDDKEQLWHIQECSEGSYTISTTDSRNFWALLQDDPGTPVELYGAHTDQRCWWTFVDPETKTPVNEGARDECLLFEMKLLPILLSSPLKLDFVIIQEVSEDSISNASRTIGEMCGPLLASRRSRPDALCANVIEFRAPSSNKVFFQRFSGFQAFETLCKLDNPEISWKRCGGSSLPDIAIRGLRADATKVAVLNLNAALLQQGNQAILALINRLAKHDITLVLTPIQPIWRDIFYNGHVFQELEKLSSESRLFEKKDEFSDYVVDYDEAVALPRLAEYPGLRDEVRPSIPYIIEVLIGENPEAQSGAIITLSQLAEHAELHDTISEAMVEVVGMLKDENYDARSSAAAMLSKLVEHAQLHDIVFHAVLEIIEMLMRESGHAHLFEPKHHQVGGIFRDAYGRTALSWAAQSGHDAVVRLLLVQKGVKVDNKDASGWTPLSWAAQNGHDGVVCLLLEKEGVDADSRDRSNRTPLSRAAQSGREAVVRLLLAQEGADADSKDASGRTPLSWAAQNGHDAVIRLLLAQEGVEADSKDKNGWTPLFWAAVKGHDAVVELLLAQEGVNPDSGDEDGRTPLSWAAQYGHDAVVRLLLAQEGVEAHSKGIDRQTPLSWAAQNGHDAVVRLLLAHDGVDANSKDIRGQTPLSFAAEEGHDAVVRLLLAQEGVDVDFKDIYGRTSLSLAAEEGHDAVVRLLLARGAVDTRRKKLWMK